METLIGEGLGTQPGASPVIESSTANFGQDVIEASMAAPVIVDFWAPWCGPCKQLGPLLEKAVAASRGAVRMVKVNIDENQDLAAQLRIQSIPTVYAFFQGRPVDGFQGALPESQVKDFVERMAKMAGAEMGPSPVDQALEQAEAALEGGQVGAASALFNQILQVEPDNKAALAGTLRCMLATGDQVGAREVLDALDEETRQDPTLASIVAQLELAENSPGAEAIAELNAKLEQNPNDHQSRFDLALALQAAGRKEDAAEALLAILERDRNWNDEAARKELLTFFEAWGPTDPLTLQSRRRLSSLLFS